MLPATEIAHVQIQLQEASKSCMHVCALMEIIDMASVLEMAWQVTECNANTVQETSALIEKPFDASNCQLERDSGPCFAYFEQFFFNKNSQKCEMFVYGGCLGNENRFKTLQDCQKSCEAIAAKKPFDKASCNLDRDSGPCFAYFENFFYNKNSKKCETFVYGGCLGNENRFVTRKECENSCLTQNNVVDKPKEDVCKLKSDGGMCRARIERFFYNDTAKECQKFNYGGCQGIVNLSIKTRLLYNLTI